VSRGFACSSDRLHSPGGLPLDQAALDGATPGISASESRHIKPEVYIMKFIKSWSFSAVSICLLVLTGVRAWASPFGQLSPAAANAQGPQQDQQDADSDEAITFTGTVTRDTDQFTLRNSSGAVYLLDDSERARPFEGKPVKVTGSFGNEARMIHVETIELIVA
jgi:hypothetical protein